jgi:MFS family permease
VRHDELTAANALSSFGMQSGVLVGPTIGGLIVASAGPEWCFLVDIVGLFVASMMYAAMRRYPHVGETEAPSLAGIGKGLRYALSRRDLLGTYLVDLAAMLLAMPVVLFPALAEKVFGDPHLLGLLYSAETIGALVATASSGWTSRVHHHWPRDRAGRRGVRRLHRAGGLLDVDLVAAVFFALAGGADMISAVFRGTIWSQTIPDTCAVGSPASRCSATPSDRSAARYGRAWSRTDGRSAGRSSAAASRASPGSRSLPCGCRTSGGTTSAPTSTPGPSGRPAAGRRAGPVLTRDLPPRLGEGRAGGRRASVRIGQCRLNTSSMP